MADAVRSGSCVGIGIGRPAASDPYLPAEIVSGTVSGATVSGIPSGDFAVQLVAACAQIEAIARGEPVFDLSNTKDLERFGEAFKVHVQHRAQEMSAGIVTAGHLHLPVPKEHT